MINIPLTVHGLSVIPLQFSFLWCKLCSKLNFVFLYSGRICPVLTPPFFRIWRSAQSQTLLVTLVIDAYSWRTHTHGECMKHLTTLGPFITLGSLGHFINPNPISYSLRSFYLWQWYIVGKNVSKNYLLKLEKRPKTQQNVWLMIINGFECLRAFI